MEFLLPKYLYLLFLLPVFLIIFIFDYRARRVFVKKSFFDEVSNSNIQRAGRDTIIIRAVLLSLAFIFIVLSLARPSWGKEVVREDTFGIEVMLLLDCSSSMLAQDLKPNRFIVAKDFIKSICKKIKGDYMGLINFAGRAYVQCPLTKDYEALELLADSSLISSREDQGTDLNKALELAIKSFDNKNKSHRVVIVITDGEDQEKAWNKTIEKVKGSKLIIHTIGIGSVEGAPIPVKDKNGDFKGWKKDNKGNMVKTRLDEKTLMVIAAATNGQYYNLNSSSAVESLISSLEKFNREILGSKTRVKKKNRYYIPLFLALIAIIAEMSLGRGKVKW